MELAQKNTGKNAVFVSISHDDEDTEDAVREFLQSKGATFTNFRLTNDAAEVFENATFKEGVPLYLVYSSDGKLVVNTHEFTELQPEVDKILNK